MGFRNELEAKEAQLARLRRENEELRDELEASERRQATEREERSRADAAKRASAWRRLFGSAHGKRAGDTANAAPTHELDRARASASLRLGSWLIAAPCLGLAWGACALVYGWVAPSVGPLWLRQVMATLLVLLMTPAIRNNLVFGVASAGVEGYRKLSAGKRLESGLIWLGASVVVGAMAGFADGEL